MREREFLLRAASSKYGIVLRSADLDGDMGRLKAALRAELKLSNALENIEIWRSPWSPRDEIWLVKIIERSRLDKEVETTPGPALMVEDINLKDLGLE